MARYSERKESGFSIAGLVLGIIGVCTSIIPFINNLSFVMGVLAIIFGIIAFAKKSGKGKIIASIILGILAITITLNSQEALSESIDTATGDNTEEVLKNDVEVILGNFEIEKDEYGFSTTKLTVRITNKTSETKSFNIQIEAIDSNGARIANDYIYANSLNGGQSQEFEIFEYVESDKLDLMSNATFRVVEASMY